MRLSQVTLLLVCALSGCSKDVHEPALNAAPSSTSQPQGSASASDRTLPCDLDAGPSPNTFAGKPCKPGEVRGGFQGDRFA